MLIDFNVTAPAPLSATLFSEEAVTPNIPEARIVGLLSLILHKFIFKIVFPPEYY